MGKINKEKKMIVILMLVMVILLILVIFWAVKINILGKKEQNNQNSVENLATIVVPERDENVLVLEDGEVIEDEYYEEDEYDNDLYDERDFDFSDWIGKFTDGTNTIIFARDSEDTLKIEIIGINENGEKVYEYLSNVEFDYSGRITYADPDSNEELKLHLTEGEVEVKANSKDSESIFNRISGTYIKENVENHGWNGVYENDDNQITLSEIANGQMLILIDEYWENITDNYDYEKITYEGPILEGNEEKGTEKIVITKTADGSGIKVTEAVSNDTEGSFNELNGAVLERVD